MTEEQLGQSKNNYGLQEVVGCVHNKWRQLWTIHLLGTHESRCCPRAGHAQQCLHCVTTC